MSIYDLVKNRVDKDAKKQKESNRVFLLIEEVNNYAWPKVFRTKKERTAFLKDLLEEYSNEYARPIKTIKQLIDATNGVVFISLWDTKFEDVSL